MKLQVDITTEDKVALLDALDYVYEEVAKNVMKGRVSDEHATGLFELLDSQPAAEQS